MRRALWAVTVLALVSIGCADGTDENSSDMPTAGTTVGGGGGVGGATGGVGGMSGVGGGNTCGDGTVDPMANEQCEPSVPHNLTCGGLMMGTGMIVCNSSCRLMMMCTGDQGGTGGDDGANMGGNGG